MRLDVPSDLYEFLCALEYERSQANFDSVHFDLLNRYEQTLEVHKENPIVHYIHAYVSASYGKFSDAAARLRAHFSTLNIPLHRIYDAEQSITRCFMRLRVTK